VERTVHSPISSRTERISHLTSNLILATMSSSPTVGQIVRQIIEQLSDGVSQLVLMVVVLQEQNADVPPSLPNAASAVMQTAVTLSRVASQLADTNYKNFPAIAKEIIDSATAVNDANGTMSKAIGVLTTSSDRKVRLMSSIFKYYPNIWCKYVLDFKL